MKTLRLAGVLAAGFGANYYAILRRPVLTWGATESEAASRLPGDELLEDANGVSTRAIDMDAPAPAVWPWLAQMGPSPRGGAYTYDWIENLLGFDMHSAERVLPEFQSPNVGETIEFGSNRMRLARVEPEHVLAWRSEGGDWVWTFVLSERRRPDQADQPQPLPVPSPRRALRHAADGGWLTGDGAQDAPRHQEARRAARLNRLRATLTCSHLSQPGASRIGTLTLAPGTTLMTEAVLPKGWRVRLPPGSFQAKHPQPVCGLASRTLPGSRATTDDGATGVGAAGRGARLPRPVRCPVRGGPPTLHDQLQWPR